jgi:hypothetical protein
LTHLETVVVGKEGVGWVEAGGWAEEEVKEEVVVWETVVGVLGVEVWEVVGH